MTHLTATEARRSFSETLNNVRYNKERVVLHRNGKDFAAILPVEDLELLEALEDREDAKILKRAIAAATRKGEKPIPLDEARKRLGL